jgi:hypothetical protein
LGFHRIAFAAVCAALALTVYAPDASAAPFLLTVTMQGTGSGTVISSPYGITCFATCSSSLQQATVVELTPNAAAGSSFTGWGGACSGTGTCTLTMDAAKAVTATFHHDNPPRLVNISARMQVLGGNDRMIAGFVIGGSSSKTVVINVAGPSLNAFGLNGVADPTLTLVRSSDQSVVATNDDWQTQATPSNVAAIQATGFQPNNPKEPAIIATLPPGGYTAIVEGVGGGTGTGLVGVFEVDRIDVPLINISTRGQVLTNNDVMIAGFIVQGDGPQRVVINVAGPSLNAFGLAGLTNPTLTLVRASDNTIIATNDDWESQESPRDLSAIQASGFQPSNASEPAISATLPPGAYTAIVQGVGGGTGIGLVGVFMDSAIRLKVADLINAAEACKTIVAEYYQANGVFPDSSVCSHLGTQNSDPPHVGSGYIDIDAIGALALQLANAGSGTTLTESAVFLEHSVVSSGLRGWDCMGTTIAREYLPANCR